MKHAEVYKALRDITYNFFTIRKGERLFSITDKFDTGYPSYQPEYGTYQVGAEYVEDNPEYYVRVKPPKYSQKYYQYKHEIAELKKKLKIEKER